MARRAFVELCQTADDWIELREIFTRSFKRYPLFEYVLPNQHKRMDFVRKFIDANYDVHAADGSAVPLLIKKLSGEQRNSLVSTSRGQNSLKNMTDTFGGVLFIEPAKNGIGWSTNPNEVYIKSYLRHGLREIDSNAFERLTEYEEWETEHVTDYIFGMKIPLWNGMLCAIDPKYAGNGIGCEAFSECMKYLSKRNTPLTIPEDVRCKLKNHRRTKNSIFSQNEENHVSSTSPNPLDSISTKIMRNLSLITHHPHYAFSMNSALSKSYDEAQASRPVQRSPVKNLRKKPECHQLLALSHCPRAVHFHTKNGFRCINKFPYRPPGRDTSAFDVYVLMTDINDYL